MRLIFFTAHLVSFLICKRRSQSVFCIALTFLLYVLLTPSHLPSTPVAIIRISLPAGMVFGYIRCVELEWRKYVAEFFGTFSLVFAGTGAIVVNDITNGGIGDLGIAVAFGLVVMIMVYSLGDISGAHINPAVTLSFAIARHFPLAQVPLYWLSQFSGAIAASLLVRLLYGNFANLGATMPKTTIVTSFILEVILGIFLMVVVMAVATGTKEVGGMAAIAIGGAITLSAIFAGPISGASINPARSFAPALVTGNLNDIWIYLLAPTIGAIVGALFYQFEISNFKSGINDKK